MRAIVATDRAAEAAEIRLVELPKLKPAINDVVVEGHASGFVPAEGEWPSTWADRAGRDRTSAVIGHQLAGVVSCPPHPRTHDEIREADKLVATTVPTLITRMGAEKSLVGRSMRGVLYHSPWTVWHPRLGPWRPRPRAWWRMLCAHATSR
jgi:hypothetical protein